MTAVTASAPLFSVPPAPGAPTDVALETPLLPAPLDLSGGDLLGVYALFVEDNHQDSKTAKSNVETDTARKRSYEILRDIALDEARKAAEDGNGGIFDSLGIASVVGIAVGCPILVLADVGMHMAHLTPDFVRDFENDNKASIEVATQLYCALSSAAVLSEGLMNPEAIRAAVALGGLLVKDTQMFGSDASDWASAGMVISGSADGRAAALVLVSDKDSPVADGVRTVERDTKEYTRWVAVAGMAVAAGAAIIGSAGTAALPVVLIGVALSAGGFAIQETGCLDPLIGKDASVWIGGGMLLTGTIMTGAGPAGGVKHALDAVEGACQIRSGLDGIEDAAVEHDVDAAQGDAMRNLSLVEHIKTMIEDLIDGLRDLKESHDRVVATVGQAIEIQCDTQLMAAGGRA